MAVICSWVAKLSHFILLIKFIFIIPLSIDINILRAKAWLRAAYLNLAKIKRKILAMLLFSENIFLKTYTTIL